MLERKCAGHREELRSLQSMHDALQSEHTAGAHGLALAQGAHGREVRQHGQAPASRQLFLLQTKTPSRHAA